MLDLKVKMNHITNHKQHNMLKIENYTLYIKYYILKIIKMANNKLESKTHKLQSITYITNYK